MAATTGTTTKRRGRGKWIGLGVLVLGGFIAVEGGFAGYGWAQLRSSLFPRDEALLGYLPPTTKGVAIVDPHQIDLKVLGTGATRSYLDRVRKDVKDASGIDLGFDVDKMVVSSSLVVAKGRFDASKLESKLAKHHYGAAEYKGYKYLVHPGDDAIAVLDSSVLLYGDEAGIKGAIDARASGESFEKNEQAMASLKRVGWNHPFLVTYQVTDQAPSLRRILAGSGGPKAVTAGIDTKAGLDVDTVVESAGGGSAQELQKLLEEKRSNADALKGFVGPELAEVLVDVSKKAVIASNDQEGTVRVKLHLDDAQVETLAKGASQSAPLGEIYKSLRLYQLLVP